MTTRSSGRRPAAAAGEFGMTRSTYGGVRVTTSGTSTMPSAASDERIVGPIDFGQFGRREAAGEHVVDRRRERGDGQRVVEPRAGEAAAQLFAEHAEQPALRIGERTAGGAGIVGGGVDHVDVAAKVGGERAAAGFERRDGRDHAVQHADRLVAGGDAEQIAERQHARAGLGGGGCRQIEVGHVVVARIELQHGDFRERIGGDVLGREVAAVVEHDRHFVGSRARSSRP